MASARVPRDMEKGESLEVTHPEFELLADPPGCLPTAADRTGSAPARSWGGDDALTPLPPRGLAAQQVGNETVKEALPASAPEIVRRRRSVCDSVCRCIVH